MGLFHTMLPRPHLVWFATSAHDDRCFQSTHRTQRFLKTRSGLVCELTVTCTCLGGRRRVRSLFHSAHSRWHSNTKRKLAENACFFQSIISLQLCGPPDRQIFERTSDGQVNRHTCSFFFCCSCWFAPLPFFHFIFSGFLCDFVLTDLMLNWHFYCCCS